MGLAIVRRVCTVLVTTGQTGAACDRHLLFRKYEQVSSTSSQVRLLYIELMSYKCPKSTSMFVFLMLDVFYVASKDLIALWDIIRTFTGYSDYRVWFQSDGCVQHQTLNYSAQVQGDTRHHSGRRKLRYIIRLSRQPWRTCVYPLSLLP